MKDGQCVSGWFLTGPGADQFYFGFAISIFINYYAIPLHLFCHSIWDGGDQYAQKEKTAQRSGPTGENE